MSARELASFWWENIIAVVDSTCFSANVAGAETSSQMLKVSFFDCDWERAKPPSIKKPCQLFLEKEKYNEALLDAHFLRIHENTLS